MAFEAKTTRRQARYIGWSYSKLKNFRDCPRRHLECDIEKKWNEGETNDHIEFGNAVHKAMEDRLKFGTPIPAHLQSSLSANMEAWCLKVLHGYENAEAFGAVAGQRLGVELQLAITEAYEPCGWFDKQQNVWSRAKIDVAKIKTPGAILIDWKTGKVQSKENEQLLISAAIMFAHVPSLEFIRTCYVWLKEDAETTLDVKRSDVGNIWADLLPQINHYRKSVAENNFPEKPSGLCRWCPVRTCQHNAVNER